MPSDSQSGTARVVLARMATWVVSWVMTTRRPFGCSRAKASGLTTTRSAPARPSTPIVPSVTAATWSTLAFCWPSWEAIASAEGGTTTTSRAPHGRVHTPETRPTAWSPSRRYSCSRLLGPLPTTSVVAVRTTTRLGRSHSCGWVPPSESSASFQASPRRTTVRYVS